MQLVVGVFDTQDQAEGALVRLRQAGYSEQQMALVANVREGDAAGEPAPSADAAPRSTPAAAQDSTSATVVADKADTADTPDTAGPPQLPPTSHEADQAVENAALGAAIGVIAGGAMAGPLGIAIGGAAGGGIAAWLARRHASASKMPTYADEIGRGRYLLAVEVDGPPAEAHSLLDEAGATRVEVEPM